jgi:hypothetical protein
VIAAAVHHTMLCVFRHGHLQSRHDEQCCMHASRHTSST